MLKSRIGKEPSPGYWADFVATVEKVFPGATLDLKTLEELYGLVAEQWRNGVQSHLIARQLCTCDGKKVVPSPAAQAHLARQRGLARAPKGASPGTLFGPGQLRPPAQVSRLMNKLAQIEARIQRGTEGLEVLALRAQRGSPARSAELLSIMQDAKQALDALAVEQADAESALEAITSGSRWANTRAPVKRKERKPKVAKEPKAAKESKAAKKPKAAREPRAAKEPKAPKAPKAAREPKALKAPMQPRPAKAPKAPKAPKQTPEPTAALVPDDIADAFVDELNEIAGKS